MDPRQALACHAGGGLFATFCEKMGAPLKGILDYEGVDHVSTKAGRKTTLLPCFCCFSKGGKAFVTREKGKMDPIYTGKWIQWGPWASWLPCASPSRKTAGPFELGGP